MTKPLVLAAALLAAPAGAQTFEDAVQANILLGVELCMRETGSTAASVAAFQAAGFTYEREDTYSGGTLFETFHRFAAPADTARVELYEGQTAPYCRTQSDHMGAMDMAQILNGWLAQRYPGRFAFRPIGTMVWGSPAQCPSFVDARDTSGLPYEILIGPAADAATCQENRTVSVTPGRFP